MVMFLVWWSFRHTRADLAPHSSELGNYGTIGVLQVMGTLPDRAESILRSGKAKVAARGTGDFCHTKAAGFSPEAELVHGHGQVSRLTETLVDIPIVHGDQVHIAEDEALIVVLLQGLHVTHVQQLGSVKGFVSILRDKNTPQCLIGQKSAAAKVQNGALHLHNSSKV